MKVIIETKVIGVSMDDFLGGKTSKGRVQGRAAEGVKDGKVAANTETKEKKSTVLQNQYLKGTVAKTADAEVGALVGFGLVKDEEPRQDRGDRRGARGGARDEKPRQTQGRRQNAKVALKKTEEEFPSL